MLGLDPPYALGILMSMYPLCISISPSIGDERDDGVPNSSSFPRTDLLHAAGILEDFLFLVGRVGLTTYMEDERDQHVMLTKTFVESFPSTTHISGLLFHSKYMIGLLL